MSWYKVIQQAKQTLWNYSIKILNSAGQWTLIVTLKVLLKKTQDTFHWTLFSLKIILTTENMGYQEKVCT